jgi:hypothetical protein
MPTNPYAFDPTNNTEDMRNVESEKQVTPIPGAPLNVTGVKIRDGQQWREVLNDPEYVARRSGTYPSILQHHTGPQIRLAMTSAEDYAAERWREGSKYFFSVAPELKAPWSVQPAPGTLYRGLALRIPPELLDQIRPLLGEQSDDDETFGQHLKVGPMLMKHIQETHGGVEQPQAGTGTFWSTDPAVAEDAIAATQSFNEDEGYGLLPVMMTAEWDGEGLDYDKMNAGPHNWVGDKEQVLTPGTPLRVKSLRINAPHMAPKSGGYYWLEVLNPGDDDPDYRGMGPGPQHHFAFSPPTYIYRGPKVRPAPPRPEGFVDESDYNFTGSPETQYHHRSITPETVKGIDKREDNIDIYYEEMHQRKEQGLEPIPWNEWLSRVAYSRNIAMAWDEWAPKVKQHGEDAPCSGGNCPYNSHRSWYIIDHGDGGEEPPIGAYRPIPRASYLDYEHTFRNGEPSLRVNALYTDSNFRRDGIAEAFMRRLVQDHPGVRIDPGLLLPDGQKFHDRMLEKEPSARELVTALRLAMAWGEF